MLLQLSRIIEKNRNEKGGERFILSNTGKNIYQLYEEEVCLIKC